MWVCVYVCVREGFLYSLADDSPRDDPFVTMEPEGFALGLSPVGDSACCCFSCAQVQATTHPCCTSETAARPSDALNRVRDANVAAEAEDQAKYELKDTVDARLAAWRAGKENNIRALIASLDTVLWPELGWQKVGIHELVSPSQVKIRYTKAIAKLHPDKVRTLFFPFA